MKRIALITGANRGLGLETARRFARAGEITIIGSRELAAGAQVAAELRGEGFEAEAVKLDVTSEEEVRAAAGEVERRHGRLDVLINNAGILPEASAGGDGGPLSAELFRATYDTNVFGAVRVIEAFLPLLRKSDAGRIVNVSSSMGSLADQTDPQSPFYGVVVPAYQSSKAALNGITIALSKSLADTSIMVHSVCPGFVQTDLTPLNRDRAPATADGPSGRFVDLAGSVAW
jgi:NAD(P)-dependent dehydrogenase (short-subunit alcohol dehydrogenase family)